MKESPIIPLLEMENTNVAFKAQRFTLIHEGEELNECAHSHKYFEVIWVVNGKGKIYVDFEQFELANNMILFVRPDQAHYFEIYELMEGFVFSFKDSFFKSDICEFDWMCKAGMSQLFYECQAISVHQDAEEDMKGIAMKMIKEFESRNLHHTDLIRIYMMIFLIYATRGLSERCRESCETREMQLVKRFMDLLDKNFKEKRRVAEYAGQLAVTPNHLSCIIRKNTGFSAGYHIRQRVVLEAKRMARYSTAGMKEIAYSLGFANSAHFSKYFKISSGINFSYFKREEGTDSIAVLNGRA